MEIIKQIHAISTILRSIYIDVGKFQKMLEKPGHEEGVKRILDSRLKARLTSFAAIDAIMLEVKNRCDEEIFSAFKQVISALHSEDAQMYKQVFALLEKSNIQHPFVDQLQKEYADISEQEPSTLGTLQTLTDLMFKIENNGVAQDHAARLFSLFNDTRKTLDYLLVEEARKSQHGNIPKNVCHDACLFEFPVVNEPTVCKHSRGDIIRMRDFGAFCHMQMKLN